MHSYLHHNSPTLVSLNKSPTKFENSTQIMSNDNSQSYNSYNQVKNRKVELRVKKQISPNSNIKLNSSSVRQTKYGNLGISDAGTYNKITNDIKSSLKQKMKKNNPDTTKTTFFYGRQDNFVGADPNRISKYRKPMDQVQRQREKWDKSLQRYMEARTKMSIFFNQTRKNSGEFNKIQLDRNNVILKKRKLLQLQSLSPKNRRTKNQNQFVSYLIPKLNKDNKIIKNQMIKSVSNNGNIKRCDALLVNFVSTYFRRKFFKKNRKLDSLRRMKTDQPELSEMVALQGSAIDDQIINTNMLDRKYTQRKTTIARDEEIQYL